MKALQIKVSGPRFGEPLRFIWFLENTFQRKAQVVSLGRGDEGLELDLPDYKGTPLLVTALTGPLFGGEATYRSHLEKADGMIYMLTTGRDIQHVNVSDSEVFRRVCESLRRQPPVIFLLNDIWEGGYAAGNISTSEAEGYVLPGSGLRQTAISGRQGQGALEALDALLAMVPNG